jgi:hypothetical protein
MAGFRAVVIQENWETYSYGSEGGPVFASFYAGAGDIARQDFPFCARVIIPIRTTAAPAPVRSSGLCGSWLAGRAGSIGDGKTTTLGSRPDLLGVAGKPARV